MPLLLRTIKKARWHKDPDLSWITPPDIPADPLSDLVPKETGNRISVWLLEENKSNLGRIAAAISAGREYLVNFDCALIPTEMAAGIGMIVTESAGDTADEEANNNWHRHIVQLTAGKLSSLAREMYSKAEIVRLNQKQVRELLAEGIRVGQIKRDRVKESLVSQLN